MAALIKLGLMLISGGLAYFIAKDYLGATAPISAISALSVAIAGYATLGSWIVDGIEALIKEHRGE